MKVSFTTKEYARLLELAQLGLTVAGGQAENAATAPVRYAALVQKLLSLAPEFGCAQLIETDTEGLHHPSPALLEGPQAKHLDSFVDDTFWGELVERLAERDLLAEMGASFDRKAPLLPEVSERLRACEDNYWDEFEKHGVDRLFVLKGGQG